MLTTGKQFDEAVANYREGWETADTKQLEWLKAELENTDSPLNAFFTEWRERVMDAAERKIGDDYVTSLVEDGFLYMQSILEGVVSAELTEREAAEKSEVAK
jgi:tryptophan 2,3-dioxygenase